MESSNGMTSGQDNLSQPELAPSAAPSISSSPDVSERVFKQSEVNEIVGRAKREAVEKDRRHRVEQPEYSQQKYSESTPNQVENNREDNIRKIVAEETQRQREAWEQQTRQRTEQEQAQAIVNKFWNKISTGKEKYQDFEKVVGDIEYGAFPNVVQILADHVENSAEMLYELGKDRFKMSQLESLSRLSPRDAIIQAQRLATSIKENEQAAKVRLPNEPLSQLRPSVAGTSNGPMSIKDLRMKYRG